MGLRSRIGHFISEWLVRDISTNETPHCDFERLRYEIRPGDILLVEGRSRISEVIKIVTQSPWSHAALYIGRLHDIDDSTFRNLITQYSDFNPDEQLIIESILGKGTIITTLDNYAHDHLRICRPRGLTPEHAQRVSEYAINTLGSTYDIRQLLDLARFIFPYGILPRRWRSSLFDHNAGIPTQTVCSTMLAQAFMSVRFPILPVIDKDENGDMILRPRNPRRFIPSDFDYSPYFDIIKYPYLNLEHSTIYEQLPWSNDGIVCNSPSDCFVPNNKDDNKKNKGGKLKEVTI